MISSIIQANFHNNSGQYDVNKEKKQQRIYDLLNTKTKPKKIYEIIEISLWPPSSPDA